jgi:Uma2 family endonuclease
LQRTPSLLRRLDRKTPDWMTNASRRSRHFRRGLYNLRVPVEITKRLFDVDDYHRMAKAGILSEDDRVELIDGEIVARTPIGPRHNAAVNRATRALVTIVGDQAIVQVQGSVRLGRFREPQPDIVLLRPQPDFYALRLPEPSDIFLIIEIADSSLDYDRDLKARIYAEAGVLEYWLVNLDNHSVASYTEPLGAVYQVVRWGRSGESIAPVALPQCVIPVDVLLVD